MAAKQTAALGRQNPATTGRSKKVNKLVEIIMGAGFWKFRHDNGIESIAAKVRGLVPLDVSIRYSRQQFSGADT